MSPRRSVAIREVSTEVEQERAYFLERCLRLEAELMEYRIGVRTRGSADMLHRIVELRHTTLLTWRQIGDRLGLTAAAARQRYKWHMRKIHGPTARLDTNNRGAASND